MNLEQIEAIHAVVQHGSFRAAAEKLHRSQPSLSALIKNLENEFDILIFDRSTYRPTLTDAGAAFLGVARTALQAAQYAARVGDELGRKKVEPQLRMAIDPFIPIELIQLILLECSRPALPVNLIINPPILKGRSFAPLIEGAIDLAMAPRPDQLDGLEWIHLDDIVIMCALSRNILQGASEPSRDHLQNFPQIVVQEKDCESEAGGLVFPLDAVHSRQRIMVPDHSTKLKFIDAGLGWGRLAQQEIESHPNLLPVGSRLCAPVVLDLCLFRPRFRPIGQVARRIWASFEQRSVSP